MFINKTLSTETTHQQDWSKRDLLSTSLIVGTVGSGMWCVKFNSTSNVIFFLFGKVLPKRRNQEHDLVNHSWCTCSVCPFVFYICKRYGKYMVHTKTAPTRDLYHHKTWKIHVWFVISKMILTSESMSKVTSDIQDVYQNRRSELVAMIVWYLEARPLLKDVCGGGTRVFSPRACGFRVVRPVPSRVG